jgi:hypothetical protein
VPRRGPEAGVLRIEDDFHGLGANTLFMPVSTEPNFLKIFASEETSPFFQYFIGFTIPGLWRHSHPAYFESEVKRRIA